MAGQLIKRGTRRYTVRIFEGADANTGKRRYTNKQIHGTRKQAETYRDQAIVEKELGRFVKPPPSSTLNAYLD